MSLKTYSYCSNIIRTDLSCSYEICENAIPIITTTAVEVINSFKGKVSYTLKITKSAVCNRYTIPIGVYNRERVFSLVVIRILITLK